MKNQRVLALSLCLVLVLGLSFAMAAGNKVGKDKSYGSCVSAQAKIKNSCYKGEKATYKGCNTNVKQQYKNRTITNRTQIKNMNTDCRNTYKEEMNQCKLAFKVRKENCAKPNNSPQEEGPQEEEKEKVILNSTSCNSNGGIWNECGNKCAINSQGQENVSCTTVCEELCECGTGANLTCPTGRLCKTPQGFANALGYCE